MTTFDFATRMTVAAFLAAHPKSMLADAIRNAGLSSRKKIYVFSGLESDNPRAKLQKVRNVTGWRRYLVGGMAGPTRACGHWMAVYR